MPAPGRSRSMPGARSPQDPQPAGFRTNHQRCSESRDGPENVPRPAPKPHDPAPVSRGDPNHPHPIGPAAPGATVDAGEAGGRLQPSGGANRLRRLSSGRHPCRPNREVCTAIGRSGGRSRALTALAGRSLAPHAEARGGVGCCPGRANRARHRAASSGRARDRRV